MCENTWRRQDHGLGATPRWQEWYEYANQNTSNLQADGNADNRPARILDPNGNPIPRRVHRIGFQSHMVVE